MNSPPGRKRMTSWLIAVGLVILAVALLLVVGSLSQVEDWSRDLTVNHAATAADHADERLRPLAWSRTVSESTETVAAVVARLPRWRFESREDLADGATIIRLTRSTRLWRFIDDLEVRIEPTEEGSVLHLTSRSRVGRGDLGQNPRNLRELLDALRSHQP